MAEAAAVAKGRPTVLGVDDDTLNMFSTLTTDVEHLSDGMMADLGVVIVGIEGKKGGEELESKTKPGEYYTTQDQMIVHLRVDDSFEKGFETDIIQWYLNLPREVEKDGQRSRAEPGRQSDYGVFLTDLEALGVSANAANAANFQFESVRDLIGLHFRRIQRNVEQRDGTQRRQFRAEDLYGIDNDVRAEVGLAPAYIKGQEPAGTKRGAAASA